ncbi:uracil-DNA glycosylase, partial [Kaarinaea lacus]
MAIDERQQQYLQAMGVQTWLRRESVAEPEMPEAAELNSAAESPVTPEVGCAPAGRVRLPAGDNVYSYNWDQLQGAVRQCIACDLHSTRKNTVFGVGNEQADWMVVGEAPGADEDRQGEPFVGKAGQLLNNMLLAIGLQRQQVYIANILKCRPPNNRDPRPEEVVKCEPYLKRQ